MSKVLGALVGVALLGSVGVASAAEPVPLTDNQMDGVSAGIDIAVIRQRATAIAVAVNYSPGFFSGGNVVAAAAEAKNVAVVNQ
jgi:phosphoribosylformimino-5-aminoimidazole carboxamide ribonucleotide (ProFAR) isomerase